MPAAARGDRRGPARARRQAPAARVKARPAGPPPRAVSKLHAGRRVGFPARAAGLALGLAAALVGAVVLATGERAEQLVALAQGINPPDAAALGLTVKTVELKGATPAARDEIRDAAAVPSGASLFTVDLDAIRRRVETVGWVDRARVVREWPDTIQIAVTQRPLLAVWQHAGRAQVIMGNGVVADAVDPARFSTLPLVVGPGAEVAAKPIIALLQAHPKLWSRTHALVRVDQRRWDLTLTDGGVVALPARDEAAALSRLDALEVSARVLDLKLARIDLRDPEMIIVRPRGTPAVASMQKG